MSRWRLVHLSTSGSLFRKGGEDVNESDLQKHMDWNKVAEALHTIDDLNCAYAVQIEDVADGTWFVKGNRGVTA